MSKRLPLEDIKILRRHRLAAQKERAEKDKLQKETQGSRSNIAKKIPLQPEVTQTHQTKPKQKKIVIPKKKQVDLNGIINTMEHGIPFSAEDIAAKLGLDFSKKVDKKRLALSLTELVEQGLIDNQSGRFIRPFEKQVDLENAMVGVVRKENGTSIFVSTNPNTPKIDIPDCRVPDGTIVTVVPTSGFNHAVRVVMEHGNLDDATADSMLSALARGIPIEFPQAVLDETIGMSVPAGGPGTGRKDYTNKKFIAVDPATAKDKDDAFYVTKTSKGWRVMVAVADVAHYVLPGSEIWKEALRRGNSTYTPGLTIPMLPPVLSNGLCSLHQGEVRAAKVTTIDIDKDGNILKHKVEPAIIRCHASLNYDEVQEAINGKATGKVKELYNKYIVKAQNAAEALIGESEKRGQLDLNVSEQRIDYSEDTGFSLTEERNTLSHQIIAYLMIVNNRTIPNELEALQKPIISRAHAEPSQKSYDRYLPELERLGVRVNEDLSLADRVRDIAAQSHKDKKNGTKIRQILIRIQDRARYTVGREMHYGLGLKDGYSHFTSPIRRFSDLLCHSMLSNHESHDPEFFTEDNLKEVVKHLSKTERRSEEAEREAKTRAIASWLSGNMGKVFNAQVIGINAESQELELRVIGRSIHTHVSVVDASTYKENQKVQIIPKKADRITGVVQFKMASNNNTQDVSSSQQANQTQSVSAIRTKPPLRKKPQRYRHSV